MDSHEIRSPSSSGHAEWRLKPNGLCPELVVGARSPRARLTSSLSLRGGHGRVLIGVGYCVEEVFTWEKKSDRKEPRGMFLKHR